MQLDCLVRIGECFLEILIVLPAGDEVLPLQIGFVGLGIRCGRTSWRDRVVAAQQSQLQSFTHGASYFVLCRKDMTDIAVVGLRPELESIVGLDQLRGNAYVIPVFADASFQHSCHSKLLPHSAKVFVLALELKGRGATDDSEARYFGEIGDQLIRESI